MSKQDTPCCSPSCCQSSTSETQTVVREKYGQLARQIHQGSKAGCCQSSASESLGADVICGNLYDEAEKSQLPMEAVLASLGCGNPTALAQLEAGQVVLDLGSGGGIDVLLSARRVGPTGKAYGLDMTDEMLALARENQRKAGATNVEFLRGQIESVPLPDESVDVIISNCVINLSVDKDKVLREAFRVLKPGGLFAVSDVVRRGDIPESIRRSLELWSGCVAGALHEDEYKAKLMKVGFVDITVEPTRVYRAEDAKDLLQQIGPIEESLIRQVDGTFYAGFVRARKSRDE